MKILLFANKERACKKSNNVPLSERFVDICNHEISYLLVVIKDYESAFDAVTLIYIP